jgi:hypothetical protein
MLRCGSGRPGGLVRVVLSWLRGAMAGRAVRRAGALLWLCAARALAQDCGDDAGARYQGPDGSGEAVVARFVWSAPAGVQLLQRVTLVAGGRACQLVAVARGGGAGDDLWSLGLYASVGAGQAARPGALLGAGEVFSSEAEANEDGSLTLRAALASPVAVAPGAYWVGLAGSLPLTVPLGVATGSDWLTTMAADVAGGEAAEQLKDAFPYATANMLALGGQGAQAAVFVVVTPDAAAAPEPPAAGDGACGVPDSSLYDAADLFRPHWEAACQLAAPQGQLLLQRVQVVSGGQLCALHLRAAIYSTAYLGAALYAEGADGRPAQLLWQTRAALEGVYADQEWQTLPAAQGASAPPLLPAGHYWLAVKASAAQPIVLPVAPEQLGNALLALPASFAGEFPGQGAALGAAAAPYSCLGAAVTWPAALSVLAAVQPPPAPAPANAAPVALSLRFPDVAFQDALHGTAAFAGALQAAIAEAYLVDSMAVSVLGVRPGSVLADATVLGANPAVTTAMASAVLLDRLPTAYGLGPSVVLTVTPPGSPAQGLSAGAVAGIVVGALLALSLALALLLLFIGRRTARRSQGKGAALPGSPLEQ